MGKCKWSDPDDWKYRCALEALPGKTLCILHDTEPKDLGEFKRRLHAQIDCVGSDDERNPQFDFRGYVFPVGIAVGGEREGVDVALPQVVNGDANFRHARIGGSARFRGAEIGGDANFQGARMGRIADFPGARIGRIANFRHAKIGGSARFWGAEVGGDADFRGASVLSAY